MYTGVKMGTHAVLGVKHPDGKITGCYLHYDGSTVGHRIKRYLKRNTPTCLYLLLSRAQQTGGLRSFPPENLGDFLDDNEPYIIDEVNWNAYHFGAHYSYLIDFETGEMTKRSGRVWEDK